jgi:hypothetical protein
MEETSSAAQANVRADRLAIDGQHADALAAYVKVIDDHGPLPDALRGAAAMLARLGRPAAAEQLLASAAADGDPVLAQARLCHARDAALPVFDAHRLLRFEAALDAARADDDDGTPTAVLRLYGEHETDAGEPALRTVLDHAALLVRLGRLDEAAPLLDAVAELVVPGTVLYARATAQRVLVFLVLERERDAGHAYAQAAAIVAREHGWGDVVLEHVAIVHDELSLVGGERDAVELLEELRAAAARADDPVAEGLLARAIAERP